MHLFGNALICASAGLECRIHRNVAAPFHNCPMARFLAFSKKGKFISTFHNFCNASVAKNTVM